MGYSILGLAAGLFDTIVTTHMKCWVKEDLDWTIVIVKQSVSLLNWLSGIFYSHIQLFFGASITLILLVGTSIRPAGIPSFLMSFNSIKGNRHSELEEERQPLIPVVHRRKEFNSHSKYLGMAPVCVICLGNGLFYALHQSLSVSSSVITGRMSSQSNMQPAVKCLVRVLGSLIPKAASFLPHQRNGYFSNGSRNLIFVLLGFQIVGLALFYVSTVDDLFAMFMVRIATEAHKKTIQDVLKI